MTDITCTLSEKHIITVRIGNMIYELNALFSMDDCEISLSCEDEQSPDYAHTLGEIIRGHLQCEEKERPSIENIKKSEAVDLYIDAVLSDSDGIREKYDLYPDINVRAERFIIAANDNTKEKTEELKEELKKIKLPKPKFSQNITPILPQIEVPKSLLDYSSITPDIKAISQAIESVTKPLIDVGTIIKAQQSSIGNIIGLQQSFLNDIADIISKTIPKIPSLSISENRIEKIREAQRIWGSYGWMIPDDAEIREAFSAPTSKAEADKIAMKYCTAKQMENLFAGTKQLKGIRLSDFEEAIANYKDRRYRSCALLLFSLIDAQLIRMQRSDDRNGGRRPVGKKAANNALKHYKDEQLTEHMYTSIFRYENLYACLMKVFEDGNDFKKQPDVINRNFLNHGMLTVRVRKRDCIQLFLLYYNWLLFLEDAKYK